MEMTEAEARSAVAALLQQVCMCMEGRAGFSLWLVDCMYICTTEGGSGAFALLWVVRRRRRCGCCLLTTHTPHTPGHPRAAAAAGGGGGGGRGRQGGHFDRYPRGFGGAAAPALVCVGGRRGHDAAAGGYVRVYMCVGGRVMIYACAPPHDVLQSDRQPSNPAQTNKTTTCTEPLPVAYTSQDTTVRPARPPRADGKRCVGSVVLCVCMCMCV